MACIMYASSWRSSFVFGRQMIFFSVNTTFTERTVEARLYSSKSLLHNTQLRSFRPSEMARCKEADIKSINTRTTYSVVVGHREGHLKF